MSSLLMYEVEQSQHIYHICCDCFNVVYKLLQEVRLRKEDIYKIFNIIKVIYYHPHFGRSQEITRKPICSEVKVGKLQMIYRAH